MPTDPLPPALPPYFPEREATMVFLVRHGQSQANVGGGTEQDTDSPLTSLGEQQARTLAQVFRQVHVDAIVSSDARRATSTMAPLALAQGRELRSTPLLQEPRSHRPSSQFADAAAAAALLDQLRAGTLPPAPTPPETHADLVARLTHFLADLPLPSPGAVVLCSHYATLNVLSRLLLDPRYPPASRWAHFDNASVTRIDIPKERRPPVGTLMYLNWTPGR